MPWEPLPSSEPPDPVPLAAGLDRLTAGLGAPTTAGLHALGERWPDIVGDLAAGHCRPGRLTDGVLVVTAEDPAWTTQLRFLEASILQQAAIVLGQGIVQKLDIRVAR